MCATAAGARFFRRSVGAPLAIEQFFDHLAVGANQVGHKANQQDLEADDEQHRSENERLDVAVALAGGKVKEKATTQRQAQSNKDETQRKEDAQRAVEGVSAHNGCS